MYFTYNSYFDLLAKIKRNGYAFEFYQDYLNSEKTAILRHDVDFSLDKACEFSEKEYERGIKSTYFIMITNDFYNPISFRGGQCLNRIIKCGHEVGLHFDEMRYPNEAGNPHKISKRILQETEILSQTLGKRIDKFSMHRPSQEIIKADLHLPQMINTYSNEFFNQVKYFSDSRRRWREPIEELIDDGKYDKIQILVHPIWYNQVEETIESTVRNFVNCAIKERYTALDENITDLKGILDYETVVRK